MLDLNRRGRDVRRFVWRLEEWVIRSLAAFNVTGERRAGRVGVWVVRPDRPPQPDGSPAEDKIAAIGVRLRRWVSFHGIAINLEPELSHFDGIVPCGIRGHGVTSLVDLGLPVRMPDLDLALAGELRGGLRRSGRAEGRVKGDQPRRCGPGEGEAEEVLGRHALEAQRRVGREIEAPVVGRVADQDAPAGTPGAEALEPRADEGGADAGALGVGSHRQRPEAVPADIVTVDRHRREGDVAEDAGAAGLGDEREGQRPGRAQPVDDRGLGAGGVRGPGEGGIGKLPDGIGVGRLLRADPDGVRPHSANRALSWRQTKARPSG